MSSEDFPRQRQVYLSKALKQSGDTKKRPVVVVSIDIRNQYSSTVLIVPYQYEFNKTIYNVFRKLKAVENR